MGDLARVVDGWGPSSEGRESLLNMIGAVFLFRDDNSLLMQLRDDKPDLRHAAMWVPPGGHIEDRETIEEGARRELLEETAYICEKLSWLQMMEITHPNWSPCLLGIFWAFYDGKQETTCKEGQDLKFIKRKDADYLPIPLYLMDLWDQLLKII